MRFEPWFCDLHKEKNLLQIAQHNPHQLPPCFDSSCKLWAARSRIRTQIAAAAAAGQDTAELSKQLRACTPHGHMGRYLSSNRQPWCGLPEARWGEDAAAATLGAVAHTIRSALREAWWPGIHPTEMQNPMQLGGAIDYLHPACACPALTQEDEQRVLQQLGSAADTETQRAALRAQLIRVALGTKCMLINQPGTQGGQLPPGCSTLSRTHPRTSQRQRPDPAASVYMRLQLSSKVRDGAHRWLAWLRLGPPPQEDWCQQAVHLCNNKNCLNPYHIVWVSTSPAQRSSETVGAGRRGGAPGSGHVSCWVHMGSMGVTWV
jgi:hypothetical protein